MRFFWRLLAGMALVVCATAAVADFRVGTVVEKSRLDSARLRVREDAWLLARLALVPLAAGDLPALRALTSDVPRELRGRRVTVVAADGQVLADSHEAPESMDAQGRQPEILEPGTVHTRRSPSLARDFVHLAQPILSQGRVLGYARVALDPAEIAAAGGLLRRELLLATGIALGVGLLLALFISSRTSAPLERLGRAIGALGRGDEQLRAEERGSTEIRNVARAVNEVGRRLREREARIVAEVGQKAAILSAMDEGLLALDAEARVVLLNDAGRAMLDPRTLGGVGSPLSALTAEPELLAAADACLKEGQRREGELRAGGADEGRLVHYVATPVLGADGRAEMAVLVLRDVTALRRLEQVRRDFVANVSHELKTPLTTMRGYLEAVLDDPEMEAGLRGSFLEKAGRSTQRLAAIVSDLLDLARLERGPDELATEPVDFAALVSTCVRSTQADAEERAVVLASRLPGSPLLVRGDDQSLITAVTNLLDNAVKYSPAGGRVDVVLARDGGRAWLQVADQGPGIPYHAQERIFERFYRVDKDRSRQLGGTGLGLSIVKNVVLAHRGEVWVESTPGEGSRFHLRLPVLDAG